MSAQGGRIARLARAARSGGWLTAARVRRWVVWIAVLTLIGGAVGIWSSFIDPETFGKRRVAPDFAAVWAAGRLVLEGRAAQAWDWEQVHALYSAGWDLSDDIRTPWLYPPTALALAAPFGAPPLAAAMALSLAAQLALFAWVCRRIRPGWTSFLGAFCVPAMLYTLTTGQLGLLWASLLGLALEDRARRPGAAALALGAMCLKPHLFALVPVALACERRWRLLGWGALVAAGLVALSFAIGGVAAWQAFLDGLERTAATFGTLSRAEAGVHAAALGLGLPAGAAWVLQALASAFALGAVAWTWSGGRTPPDIRAAVLCFALVAFMPRVMTYELHLLYIGALFQIRHAEAAGFAPWEKTTLFAAPAVVLLSLLAPPGLTGFVAPLLLAVCLRAEAARRAGAPPQE